MELVPVREYPAQMTSSDREESGLDSVPPISSVFFVFLKRPMSGVLVARTQLVNDCRAQRRTRAASDVLVRLFLHHTGLGIHPGHWRSAQVSAQRDAMDQPLLVVF